jgi:polyribonucleotide nucleotidyltransferase
VVNSKKFELKEQGIEVEIGKYASQADGAVWLKKGGTVILTTAVTSPARDFPGFLPLSVDYREYFSAVGKIPGGYLKREGRYSDREVLTSRLVDRAIRPLFPENFFEQVQILATVYSTDKINSPYALSLVAASLALTISKIPFLGPVGAIEICRIDGEWKISPNWDEAKKADAKVLVAGTMEGVCMLEGAMDNIPDDELLDAIFKAHEAVKLQIKWQEEVRDAVGQKKENVEDTFDWSMWEDRATKFLSEDKIRTAYKSCKQERGNAISELMENFTTEFNSDIEGQKDESVIHKKVIYAFDKIFKSKVNDLNFEDKKRIDGRAFDEIRDLSIEVGLLPFVHGSALFKRGQTQALVTTTLGSGQDEQRIEDLMDGDTKRSFLLHYNFPPFSVGEVKPMRGAGRREIGHGHLAASALRSQLPTTEDFPYTIRLISDILESNGSSSMATVCGSTMALMDAGVPIKNMVSGVAMGLLKNSKGEYQAITDLTGFEDAFGWMDFKIAGTDNGTTAIQLDIKNKGGLPRDIFAQALAQASVGKAHLLKAMKDVLSKPKPELSTLVPKIVSFNIDTDKIGAVIGGGGKIIREIIDTTGTTIDIEDDGFVKIFGTPESKLDDAVMWVKVLAGQLKPGMVFDGEIKRLAEFGMFVGLVPGVDGLLHISNIPRDKQQDMEKDYKVGDIIKVEVAAYEPETGRIKLKFN